MHMVKRIFLFTSLSVCFAVASAQTSICSYITADTVLSFFSEKAYSSRDILACRDSNNIIWTTYNPKRHGDTLALFSLCLDSYATKQNKVCIDRLSTRLMSTSSTLDAMDFRKNILALKSFRTLFLMKRESESRWCLWKEVSLSRSYNGIHFISDSVLLLDDVHYSNDQQTNLTALNIYTERIVHSIEPAFDHPMMMCVGPYHLVDVAGGKIIWANRNSYKIDIFDSSLSLSACITDSERKWTSMTEKQIRKIEKKYDKTEAASLMWYLIDDIFPQINQLQYVYSVTPNKLLVATAEPSPSQKYTPATIDIWENNGGKWVCTKEKIVDKLRFSTSENDVVNPHNIGLALGSASTIVFANDKLVLLSGSSVPEPMGRTQSEIREQSHKWLAERDLFLQIIIFTHTL